MSSLLLAAWLFTVPVPDEPAIRKDKEKQLTRADILKRLERAAEKPAKPTVLSELMADAVRLFKEADLHPESFAIPANDRAAETRFKAAIENEQMQISLTQYKLAVILDELQINEAEAARQDKDIQARYRYICAHLNQRIGQFYQANDMLGGLRKELPDRPPGAIRWRLTPSVEGFTDREASKHQTKARKQLQQLIEDHAGSDWAKHAAEEDKTYFIGLKWTAEK
jgi:hypothetical protein